MPAGPDLFRHLGPSCTVCRRPMVLEAHMTFGNGQKTPNGPFVQSSRIATKHIIGLAKRCEVRHERMDDRSARLEVYQGVPSAP